MTQRKLRYMKSVMKRGEGKKEKSMDKKKRIIYISFTNVHPVQRSRSTNDRGY